jgi:hypothetical protein
VAVSHLMGRRAGRPPGPVPAAAWRARRLRRSASPPSRCCGERPQDERERSRETGLVAFLRSNATALGVAAAALGGVLYVLLSWVASWVYQPAGVRPSDVGLGYVPLLAGTAVTLVVALAVVLAAVAVAFGAAWLRRKNVLAFVVAIIALLALVYFSSSIKRGCWLLPRLSTGGCGRRDHLARARLQGDRDLGHDPGARSSGSHRVE